MEGMSMEEEEEFISALEQEIEQDIYSEEGVHDRSDDDQIAGWEAGFMMGYLTEAS